MIKKCGKKKVLHTSTKVYIIYIDLDITQVRKLENGWKL